MIHGYVEYFREQMIDGIINQQQFEERFPLFSDSESDQGHTNMAFNYLKVLEDVLRKNNPTLSDHEVEALSTAGLRDSHWITENYNTDELKLLHSTYLKSKGADSSSENNFKDCE